MGNGQGWMGPVGLGLAIGLMLGIALNNLLIGLVAGFVLGLVVALAFGGDQRPDSAALESEDDGIAEATPPGAGPLSNLRQTVTVEPAEGPDEDELEDADARR